MKSLLNRYLYTIGLLKSRQDFVCALDVGRFLGLKPPAVSLALRKLREQGFIVKEPDGNLSFSPSCSEYAGQICERVSFFRQTLIGLGVEPSIADQDAVILSRKLSNISYDAFRNAFNSQNRQ